MWPAVVRAALKVALSLSIASDAQIASREEIIEDRPHLRWERPSYQNYAIQNYRNYPNHSLPYEGAPRAIYDGMGNYLATGYRLYDWQETRRAGQVYGSGIFKDSGVSETGGAWMKVFDSTTVGRDGYGGWGYSLIVGDGLIARFTPLTLSKTDFNGVRLDVATPAMQFTGLASRIERPQAYQEEALPWNIENTHKADDSVMIFGGRVQADAGLIQLGLNSTSLHVFRSTMDGAELRGRLRPDQPVAAWIIVRFSDDSPRDGSGGATVQDIQLIVDGVARPDLVPRAIRHHSGIKPQVGTVSKATGGFRAAPYTSVQTRSSGTTIYRDKEIPLFADYLYLMDHEDGIDVSGATNMPGLLSGFQEVSPAERNTADGDDQLAYLFDVSRESDITDVKVEALLANDYRVDVALLHSQNPRAKNYYSEFFSTFYDPVLRAKGNVQDLSNAKRVRIAVGEHTGLFTYSADLKMVLPGLEIVGEYARSSRYSRYPALINGEPQFEESSHARRHGAAYFLNATHWFGRGRVGGEYFSINPDYQTELRTYLQWEHQLQYSNLRGSANSTIYWELVQDNDDGDRIPDRRIGNLTGFGNDNRGDDIDGVWVGQDEDNDGFPETNRDGDRIPDYEEPFLMYDVEPNAYVYGLDRNNNDEPDRREDDIEIDYPYDYDQRGMHLYGSVDLTSHWSLAVGRFQTEQIAGPGRNRSSYALLQYGSEGKDRLRYVRFESGLRRIQDDILDSFVVMNENPDRTRNLGFRGLGRCNCPEALIRDYPPIFSGRVVRDLGKYMDSYVSETYLEGTIQPWSNLNVVQKVRMRLNWQQGGRLYNGLFQRERRLDFWSWVSRVDYTWRWSRLSLSPQYKYMLLRLIDQERDLQLQSEIRSIPSLRLHYQILPRTSLQAGLQGGGPLPYRLKGISKRNSFEQRTTFVNITNQSSYFGYQLVTIVGINRDHKKYDTRFQDSRDFDDLAFFVRGMIGFTELGRPI